MNKLLSKNKFSIALSSGLLLWASWPPYGFSPLIFIAFIPLLWYADECRERNAGFGIFRASFTAFFVWNTLCLYWIYNAGQELGILASLSIVSVPILLGALLPSLVFLLFHKIRRKYGELLGYTALICLWISYEYLHSCWEFAFPWLVLGNSFASMHHLVQWYEYTGAFGGTFWIILINCLLFSFTKAKKSKYVGLATIILITIPSLLSVLMYIFQKEELRPLKILAVQPNIDPFKEKFGSMSSKQQINELIHLSDSSSYYGTELFLWPETAIPDNIAEDKPFYAPTMKEIRDFIGKYPNASLISGATTYKTYKEKQTRTANYSQGIYYDIYNSAILIENPKQIQFYHKTKLVPGAELFPYERYLAFLGDLTINLGGTSGGYGRDNKKNIIYTQSGLGISPIICYESVFGGLNADRAREGSQIICIITNDGWWKNTAGYKQHNLYARLRAIETRRSIARSANTGISSFINQKGEQIKSLEWNKKGIIRGELNLNDKKTFYSLHGDYIARISSYISVLFLVLLIVPYKFSGKS